MYESWLARLRSRPFTPFQTGRVALVGCLSTKAIEADVLALQWAHARTIALAFTTTGQRG